MERDPSSLDSMEASWLEGPAHILTGFLSGLFNLFINSGFLTQSFH
jgi:hypothetical protein